MVERMRELYIERRFSGPPNIVNGGYVSGCIARELDGPVEVTLRLPAPPLTRLLLEASQSQATLRSLDGHVLAEAVAIPNVELALPEPVPFAQAEEATARYVGFREHPYPGCFVCGPARPPELGKGLSLFPGPVAGRERLVAAPFVPPRELCDEAGNLRSQFVWASLDCPSWFGHATFVEPVPKILLGRLAVSIGRLPQAGERCVVHGFSLGQEGRRIVCASALAGEDGTFIAQARATWVVLKEG